MSFKSLTLLVSAALLASTHYTATAQPQPADYYQPTQAAAPTQPAAAGYSQPAAQPAAAGTSQSRAFSPSAASSAGPYAYVTYHEYQPSESMSTVTCSDGANGMEGKGYNDMSSLYPNIGAANFITWNCAQCGSCWTLTSQQTGQSVSIKAIDQCSSVGGYAAHFDIAPEAFQQLGGSGVADGHVIVSYSQC